MVVINVPSVLSAMPKCCMISAAAEALMVEPMGLEERGQSDESNLNDVHQ